MAILLLYRNCFVCTERQREREKNVIAFNSIEFIIELEYVLLILLHKRLKPFSFWSFNHICSILKHKNCSKCLLCQVDYCEHVCTFTHSCAKLRGFNAKAGKLYWTCEWAIDDTVRQIWFSSIIIITSNQRKEKKKNCYEK